MNEFMKLLLLLGLLDRLEALRTVKQNSISTDGELNQKNNVK